MGEDFFPEAEHLPAWALALIQGRTGIELPADTSAQREAAKARRRFDRLERAVHGFEDLENWLLDLLRRGLAVAVSEEKDFYALAAARAADASMTGLSRAFRLLGEIPAGDPEWAERTLATLADAYLAVRAFRNRDSLPESLLYDLQAFIGISTRKEEVLAQGEKIVDTWAVLSQAEEPVEGRLQARRTWLFGAESAHFALVLEYAFGGEGFLMGLKPGTIVQGALAFYPSAWPQRALIAGDLQPIPKPVERLSGLLDFSDIGPQWARALGTQPWLSKLPLILSEVRPFVQGEHFFLLDQSGKVLPLLEAGETGWKILALSGGHPVSVFGEWDGAKLKALAVVGDSGFKHWVTEP